MPNVPDHQTPRWNQLPPIIWTLLHVATFAACAFAVVYATSPAVRFFALVGLGLNQHLLRRQPPPEPIRVSNAWPAPDPATVVG